jgi:hypothetical protein
MGPRLRGGDKKRVIPPFVFVVPAQAGTHLLIRHSPPSMLVQYEGCTEGCFRRAEDLIRQPWSVSRRIY